MTTKAPSLDQLPAIIFVPGAWEGPAVFAGVAKTLQEDHGFSTSVASLVSTGQASPGNTSLQDDIAAVRAFIEPLVSRGRHVLLVLHSAGGYIGAAAMQGLSRKERAANGQAGGVAKIAYICGGAFPEGTQTEPMPWMEYHRGRMTCKEPHRLLFNDLTPDDTHFWLQRLQIQPAEAWDGVLQHAGFKNVPCSYLATRADQTVPVEFQEKMAVTAHAEIEYCDGGHMVMLSLPHVVVDFLVRSIAEIRT